MASIDLFIKSYKGDFWLLNLALATIKKNLTGYQNIMLLIPEKDKHDFDTRMLPERTLVHYVEDEGNGWLRQQVYKIKAHEYSYADYVIFSDSDAFVDHPVNLQDLINGGNPEILFTDYNKLPDAIIWQEPTSDIIGEKIEFEYMRRLGLCYHRDTLVNLNKWKPDLEETIMSSNRFSEFNLIGAYAAKFEKEKYTWTNTDTWKYVEPTFNQIWSHCSKEEGVSEIHLREYIRMQSAIMKSFGIILP